MANASGTAQDQRVGRGAVLAGRHALAEARRWAAAFVHWHNHEHRHSGIRYVTPAQRHAGQDHPVLAARHALYRQAREAHPRRWSGRTRNWTGRGRHAEPRTRQRRGCGVHQSSAFQFDQRTCFPVPTWRARGHGAQQMCVFHASWARFHVIAGSNSTHRGQAGVPTR
jgi:hypothetical protein